MTDTTDTTDTTTDTTEQRLEQSAWRRLSDQHFMRLVVLLRPATEQGRNQRIEIALVREISLRAASGGEVARYCECPPLVHRAYTVRPGAPIATRAAYQRAREIVETKYRAEAYRLGIL